MDVSVSRVQIICYAIAITQKYYCHCFHAYLCKCIQEVHSLFLAYISTLTLSPHHFYFHLRVTHEYFHFLPSPSTVPWSRLLLSWLKQLFQPPEGSLSLHSSTFQLILYTAAWLYSKTQSVLIALWLTPHYSEESAPTL